MRDPLAPKFPNGIPLTRRSALAAEIRIVHGTAKRWTTSPEEIELFARLGDRQFARNQIAPDEREGAMLFCRTAGPTSPAYNRTGVRGSLIAMRHDGEQWRVVKIELCIRLPRDPMEVRLELTHQQKALGASRFRYFQTGDRDLD